ncbi:MAG TPA: cell division protein FtsA [Chloroflexia bacterium]|nr:cell division protein FtsA [Chloroflexia bacterium]
MPKNQERIIVGLDVGTTKICTVVGEVGRGREVNVLGAGIAPSAGLSKGMVVDIPETVRSIALSIERAERLSGCKIGSAFVGVAGNHIASLNSRGVVAVSRTDRVITGEDVTRAVDAARAIAIPQQREVLHVIPRCYVVDGHEGVRDPVGMAGFRLEVETHIVTGAVTALQNLVRCVQRTGIEVDDLVLQPLASAEAVLTEPEKSLGVVLVDIGGGTTDIAIFIEGSIWHTVVLPVGGNHLTNDLSIVLKVPFDAAEHLKLSQGIVAPPPTVRDLYGNGHHAVPPTLPLPGSERAPAEWAPPHAVGQPVQTELLRILDDVAPEVEPDDDTLIEVETFEAGRTVRISRNLVTRILEARVVQICELVAAEIKRSGYEGLLPAGIVLTGGAARLPGITEMAARVLQMPVRVSVPQGMTGLTDTLDNPAYATSVGLALWATRHSGASGHSSSHPLSAAHPRPGGNELYGRIRGFLREFLP